MNKRLVAPALLSGLLYVVSLGPVHAADKNKSGGAQEQTPAAKSAVQPSVKAENEVKSSGATTVKDKQSDKKKHDAK